MPANLHISKNGREVRNLYIFSKASQLLNAWLGLAGVTSKLMQMRLEVKSSASLRSN
jgi:hypothetical protein